MPILKISAPPLSARIGSDVLSSTLARILASGAATTKPELVRVSGLARTTVDAGVRDLFDRGVVRAAGYQQSAGRGRAAELLELNPDYGSVLVADCGRHSATLSLVDFRQDRLGSLRIDVEFSDGPEVVLESIVRGFRELLADSPRRRLVAVVGVPAPVDYHSGSFVRPPFMPGWDRFPVARHLGEALGCDVVLENDVHLRALGEARVGPDLIGPLLYIKIGTGIGAGIVSSGGALFRGADGATGEIGHLKVNNQDELCVCGSRGCLETVASVGALTRHMVGGAPATAILREDRDLFISRLEQGDPEVIASVRLAAQYIGEAIANLVHVLNPQRIVVGGTLAIAQDELLATIRSIVYQQALPISTRELMLVGPALGADSGLAGGIVLGIEHALSPERLDGHARDKSAR